MSTPKLVKHENGRFYAEWSDSRRSKRKSMGTANRVEAEAIFAQWLLVGGHRGEGPSARGQVTVGALWDIYFEKHVEANNVSPDLAANSWKNLRPHFADLALTDVGQDTVDDYTKKRTGGKIGRPGKSVTVRRELAMLRACLNWCAHTKRKPRLIEKADVPDFDLPEDSPPRERWLPGEEIVALLAAAATLRVDDRMGRGERFLWLALETTSRERAICELTWDRVDFHTGMIHYAIPGRKQTKKRRGSVPISEALRPVLLRMYEERINDYVLDNTSKVWSTIQIIAERAGLAPKAARRIPIDPNDLSKGYVKRIPNDPDSGDLFLKPKATGISAHVLRHSAATHMARNGVPLWHVAGVLKNTLQMVERVYAKHVPGALKEAVDSISSGQWEPVK